MFVKLETHSMPILASSIEEYTPAAASAQSVDITVTADIDGSLNNKYFLLYEANDNDAFVVWFNVDSTGSSPNLPGYTPVEVAIATNATAQAVSDALTAAVTALANFTATNGAGTLTTVTVTDSNNGRARVVADGNGIDWTHGQEPTPNPDKTNFTFATTLGAGTFTITNINFLRIQGTYLAPEKASLSAQPKNYPKFSTKSIDVIVPVYMVQWLDS